MDNFDAIGIAKAGTQEGQEDRGVVGDAIGIPERGKTTNVQGYWSGSKPREEMLMDRGRVDDRDGDRDGDVDNDEDRDGMLEIQ